MWQWHSLWHIVWLSAAEPLVQQHLPPVAVSTLLNWIWNCLRLWERSRQVSESPYLRERHSTFSHKLLNSDVSRSTGMWRSLWLGKWSGAFENNNLPFLLTQHIMTAKFLAKYWLDSTPVWSPWDRWLVSNFLESDHLDYCQCCLDTTKIFYLIVHICSQNVMHYVICETQD